MERPTSIDEMITLRDYMNERTVVHPNEFHGIARALAACLAEFHQGRMLHLDLCPERIMISGDGRKAYLIDSEYSVRRSDRGGVRPAGPGLSLAALPYCSPENTGRMQRAVDERSDLYALGVIFYQMLAGRLPFRGDNRLEWIYRHLAQSPPRIVELQPQVPDGLEAMIMKLLDKNPDNRYPNAGSLLADLDRMERARDTFGSGRGFHGREHELSVLNDAFLSACLGSTEMVYISGEPGIGKTRLVEELFRNQLQQRRFFYITGKFEQISSESPYQPIVQAFRGLIRHLAGEKAEQTAEWARKLRIALGSNAGIIAEMIPEAGLLLGDLPAAAGPQTLEPHKRFLYAFRKFVQALASREHPLVLFIDDLQWANASSLQLIHALLSDPESQYLLLVCAYRDAETDTRKLPGYEQDGSATEQTFVRHLRLARLSLEQMNAIVTETLNSPADATLPLTELLYRQANGNPFHFHQILLRLQDERTLRYKPERREWDWELGRMIEQGLRYAVTDLVQHKLNRLSVHARALLEAASCVGSSFHPALIASVAGRGTDDARLEWSAIEAEGMIVSSDTGRYRFAHDSIQRTIYDGIEETSRQALHIKIGRSIQGKESAYGCSSFDAIHHLNRGSRLISHGPELLRLAELNLEAGKRAKSSSAYDIALEHLAKGMSLLPPNAWEEQFELHFELHAQQAECQFLCGNYGQSEQLIDLLLVRARNPRERSRVQMIRIMLYINQGKYLESTALGLHSLRELHISIPAKPGKLTLIREGLRIESLLRNRYERLAQLEEMSDPGRIAAMNLIFAIIPSTFFTDKNIFFLLICRAIQLSLEYGNTPMSAAIYSAYGMVLGQAMGKYEKGYAIGKIGMELSKRYGVRAVQSKTYTIFGGVLSQFAGSARDGESYLAEALRFGMESGDYVFASYAIGAHVNSLYTRAPLHELTRTIADYMTVLDTTNDEFVRQNFFLYQQFILALKGETDAPDSFSGGGFDEDAYLGRIRIEETSATSLFQYHAYKTQLCYLLGRYDEAIIWAGQAEPYKAYASHLPHLPECLLYESLAACSLPTRAQKLSQRLSRNIRRFARWAQWSPDNYKTRFDLLQAEYARIRHEYQEAEILYERAIREAREQGDVPIQSLACELAARHFERRGSSKTAQFYRKLAIEGYRQWGITIKTDSLERHASVADERHNPRTATALAGSAMAAGVATSAHEPNQATVSASIDPDNIDLAAILRTSQANSNQMDMDAVLAEIIGTIVRHAGASKGALLTGGDDDLYVLAYADMDAQTAATDKLSEADSPLLPEGVIRYVLRTQESVRYGGEEDSWLIHNPYVAKHRPQSILCLPVTVHGNMLGALYLENRLAADVFAADREPVLLAMSSHGLFLSMLQRPAKPSSAEDALSGEDAPSSHEMDEPLTDRELEVLALLAKGLSNKEIADQLIIAMSTVKVHVKHIFAKLKVNRRTKAAALAKELHLIEKN
ncbi:AAA family ATPase [Cohnella hashimotonis]|uniref:AAA family ATPase n=1 Tax=Cohnella hashimotonis TaxID=2826895 RepID=A0ABT6TPH4_9BACL|nr:AAA family ATPase [Cohnella hashimotonis]MDI4648756.1 AAA family ATPase [Cohnella hashimotonis]